MDYAIGVLRNIESISSPAQSIERGGLPPLLFCAKPDLRSSENGNDPFPESALS